MSSEHLERLRKGLGILEAQISTRKVQLNTRINEKQKLTEEEETWLDNQANTIDKVRVLDVLSDISASDLKTTIEKLPPELKVTLKRLEDAIQDKATGQLNVAGASRKLAHSQTFQQNLPKPQIKQPLVCRWLKEEKKWRAQWSEGASVPGVQDAKRAPQTEHPKVTQLMDAWVTQARQAGILLTGEVLRTKWKSFADRVGVPAEERLSLSEGWLNRLKDRHGLCGIKRHGEAGSVETRTVEEERARIQKLIRNRGYRPCDIYNMDETGLFYQMPPDRGLADHAMSGTKAKKTRLTYAFTCNADGSDVRDRAQTITQSNNWTKRPLC
ncbi:hypothetical protein BN946_scf185000.g79 [Trametes cinnabarina]|uniref:HTH CENPB-type domain-containing protein n=1 Tax=Pycnoporus cinnabarinus TaxID=5643 RepID=A0A060S442_PYCCI|nr:hypothetical protein BN946_scf185000.g79 [Trametes cinnabarina]